MRAHRLGGAPAETPPRADDRKETALTPSEHDPALRALSRRHLRFGWWAMFVFLLLGLALEVMHGFKVSFLLDVSNDTRRVMWRLAHAHGVLLGLTHIAFALSLPSLGAASRLAGAGRLLSAGAILLPGGFFLGGVIVHESDPFVGIFLAPVGAFAILAAVFSIARAASSKSDSG